MEAALRLLATRPTSLADRASGLSHILSLKAASGRAMLAARALRTFSVDGAGALRVAGSGGDGRLYGGNLSTSPISIFLQLCNAASPALVD